MSVRRVNGGAANEAGLYLGTAANRLGVVAHIRAVDLARSARTSGHTPVSGRPYRAVRSDRPSLVLRWAPNLREHIG